MAIKERTAWQAVGQRQLRRERHVWNKLGNGRFKCVLCGALTRTGEAPPDVEDDAWLPPAFEPLTDAERDLCPNPGART